MLGPDFQCHTLPGVPSGSVAVEDAATFAETPPRRRGNRQWLRQQPESPDYVLADDSGLEVDFWMEHRGFIRRVLPRWMPGKLGTLRMGTITPSC